MTDEQLFKRWDEISKNINDLLHPYRWHLIATSIILGLIAGIYF